ncbi:hypothetical protein VNO80_16678 [Phaseolus coccineus]|uniref:Uncharacterized protein n=1 Tax=Phaseolus coccineus TaxID=3886 RepID=A0AAN9R882_PHACN
MFQASSSVTIDDLVYSDVYRMPKKLMWGTQCTPKTKIHIRMLAKPEAVTGQIVSSLHLQMGRDRDHVLALHPI